MYICKLKQRKYDDKINQVSELFRPAVINKTGDLSTENAKFLFFRRRSKELSLISLPINLEYMGKIIALANQKGGVYSSDSDVINVIFGDKRLAVRLLFATFVRTLKRKGLNIWKVRSR